MEDVRDVVSISMVKYETSRKQTKVKKWLSNIAARLDLYGNIMDMLVQHHPEYVSLAWGAIKFLIVVSC